MKNLLLILIPFILLAADGDTLEFNSDYIDFEDGDTFFVDIQFKPPHDSTQSILNGRLGNVNLAADAEIDVNKLDTLDTIITAGVRSIYGMIDTIQKIDSGYISIFVTDTIKGCDSAFITHLHVDTIESCDSANIGILSCDTAIINNFFTIDTSGVYTISTNTITATGSNILLDTEGAAALDTLSDISGGVEGRVVILGTVASARDVLVLDDANTLSLEGNFTLNDYRDRLVLMYLINNTLWVEISRSNNHD